MKRISLYTLIALSFVAVAYATPAPTITLTPASGTVSGNPGSVVGWGFSLNYTGTSDWVVLVGSEFTGSTVDGKYVDYLSSALYVSGPAPESSTVSQTFVPASQLGLGEFDIKSTALPGASITGNLIIYYDIFSQDPNSPTFDPNSFVEESTIIDAVDIQVAAATPEPSTCVLLLAGTLILALGIGKGQRPNRSSSSM